MADVNDAFAPESHHGKIRVTGSAGRPEWTMMALSFGIQRRGPESFFPGIYRDVIPIIKSRMIGQYSQTIEKIVFIFRVDGQFGSFDWKALTDWRSARGGL